MSREAGLFIASDAVSRLGRDLAHLGFAQRGRAFVKEGCTFALDGRWCVLQERGPAPVGNPATRVHADLDPRWLPLLRGMGEPGLWKCVALDRTTRSRVFEFPAWVTADDEGDDIPGTGSVSLRSMLGWALQCRTPQGGRGFRPAECSLIQSWIPQGALTLQHRGFIRQGGIVLDHDAASIRFPIVPSLPLDLPAPRVAALGRLVAHSQRHWRMARTGMIWGDGRLSLVTELDFTGAPLCPSLISAGLDVLRHVVAWLVETAEVLADPSMELASLAPRGVTTNQPNLRTAL